jgi:hypothetical protein
MFLTIDSASNCLLNTRAVSSLSLSLSFMALAVYFKVKATTKFEKIFSAYSQRVGKPAASLRFVFDGTRVQPHQTPQEVPRPCFTRCGKIALGQHQHSWRVCVWRRVCSHGSDFYVVFHPWFLCLFVVVVVVVVVVVFVLVHFFLT